MLDKSLPRDKYFRGDVLNSGSQSWKFIITTNYLFDGGSSRTKQLIVLNASDSAVSHHSNIADSVVVRTAPLLSNRRKAI